MRLCATADVEQGNLLKVCLAARAAIAVANLNGEYFAFADNCTHEVGSLSAGFIDEDVVVCPIHAGEFHIPSGKALDLPVTEDLQTYATWVDGDSVFADLSKPAAHRGPD